MQIKRMHILYWSGTGNSYLAARWSAEQARESGISAELVAMPDTNPRLLKLDKETLLVISGPVMGFNNPWNMVKFLIRLPAKAAEEAVCLTTRGCLKIGRVAIPGCAALAHFIPSILLLRKGIRIRGLFSVDMPSNWYFAHPPQSDENHQWIMNRAEKRVKKFTSSILERTYFWRMPNNIYESIGAVLFLPLSLLFFLFGRYNHGRIFFYNSRCNGCGLCADSCPAGAIRMRGKTLKPFWTFRCEACMRCGGVCPLDAVEAGHSWAALLYWITVLPVLNMLMVRIGLAGSIAMSQPLRNILAVSWFYLSIPIAYRIFWLLMHIPVVNWMFSHTTFTHLPGWRRYLAPGTKPAEFVNSARKHGNPF